MPFLQLTIIASPYESPSLVHLTALRRLRNPARGAVISPAGNAAAYATLRLMRRALHWMEAGGLAGTARVGCICF
jgi:hypothetical protein